MNVCASEYLSLRMSNSVSVCVGVSVSVFECVWALWQTPERVAKLLGFGSRKVNGFWKTFFSLHHREWRGLVRFLRLVELFERG